MTLKKIIKKNLAKISFHKTRSALNSLDTSKNSIRILMYHRIIDPESAPYPIEPGMYVRPETFRMHLEELNKYFQVMSLGKFFELIKHNTTQENFLEQGLQNLSFKKPTLILTFDDGWRDNYQNAFPLLKHFKFPATIFLPTNFINDHLNRPERLFWSDNLAIILKAISQGNQNLKKNFSGVISHLGIKGVEKFLKASSKDPLALSENLAKLLAILKTLDKNSFSKFTKWIEVESYNFNPERQFLTWAEILEMTTKNIEFGNHSHSHQNFTQLSEHELHSDVMTSQNLLKDHTPHYYQTNLSDLFCYPGGQFNDLTQQVLSFHKFKAALVTGYPHNKTSLIQNTAPPFLFARIGMHEDVSNTPELFLQRVVYP